MGAFEFFLKIMIDRANQVELRQREIPSSDLTAILKHVLAEYKKQNQREISH